MEKMNILIADDVSGWLLFNQQNLQKFIADKELHFFIFPSAQEAYQFAVGFEEPIHLVVTDLEMEPLDKLAGEWLIENLKTLKSTSLAKYFIISSSFEISFVAQRTSADGFLRKPSYQANPLLLKYLLEESFGTL